MSLSFPNSGDGNGKPWARLDGRTGIMFVSSPDGKSPVDLKGKVLSLNLANATQGWLKVETGGTDWQPIVDGQWGNPPSADHKPAVDVDLYCKDASFGDAKVRTARGNSRAWTSFIGQVSEKVGPVEQGAWPTIRIDAVRVVKVGAGSTIAIDFTLAPKEKWVSEASIAGDASQAPEPAPKPAAKPAPASMDDEF